MKRIVQVVVVAFACSAGAAWAQQSQEQQAQNSESTITVAQASTGAERAGAPRREAQSRKPSFHEMSGLAADRYSPSRGGPLDD